MYRTAETVSIRIYISGPVVDIERACRAYCNEAGFCVTVTPTRYIYRDGTADGAIIGIINYPRFPSDEEMLMEQARTLAARIAAEVHQLRYTIEGPDETVYVEAEHERVMRSKAGE